MRLSHTLLLVLATAALPVAGADLPVVRIGVSTPLTNGPRPDLAGNVRDGAQLAIDDLDARGVRIGGTAVRLELFTVDDQGDPGQAPATARALMAAQVAGVVGPLNSGIALRAADTYAQAGMPTLTPSATHPALTRLGHRNTFRLQPDDAALGIRLVAWAAREQHLKRVALVTEASSYGQVMSQVFRLATRQAGVEVVDEIKLQTGTLGIPAAVTRLVDDHPDAVLVAGLDTTGTALAHELRARATWFTLIGPDGFCSPNLARDVTFKPGEVLCARQGLHAPETSGTRLAAFDKRFAQRFGKAPDAEDNYAPYAYDAVRVLVAAMEDAGSSDPAVYMSHIRRTTLSDALVGAFHFDERGDVPDGAIALFTYDGAARVYKSELP